MKIYSFTKFYFSLVCIVFYSCNEKPDIKSQKEKPTSAAVVNNKVISLQQVDSCISSQLWELRIQALEMLVSRYVLEQEAINSGISVEKIVENEVRSKAKEITQKDIVNYMNNYSQSGPTDTSAIIQYLTSIFQKERQTRYVDSLKNNYSIKILLQPSYFRKADTAGIYTHNITQNNSSLMVYVISDFKCPSCQKAEKELRCLYDKYAENVKFKFVYFSEYIDDDALACEAAARQGKFREMHDIIFSNSDSLNKKSIYNDFAKKIGIDVGTFKKDIQDPGVLKRLMTNKNLLTSNKIYSTPTFLVNNQVVDGKYAIDYLETVIRHEIEK